MTKFSAGLVVAVGMLLSRPGLEPAGAAEDAATGVPARPIYVPPNRGAPASRVGGGTRGADSTATVLSVLVPEHTGLSATDQPTLYWYVSQPTAAKIELTLLDEQGVEPVLELNLDRPVPAGIQAIDLAAHGVRLQPEVEYQWSVALVVDPEQRSKDVLASGTVRYAAPSNPVPGTDAAAPAAERAAAWAGAGYWYDALAALTGMTQPGAAPDARVEVTRDALLRQVGIEHVR